jgi:hypothetical protein
LYWASTDSKIVWAVHQTAARVEQDGDGDVFGDVVLVAVGPHVCQRDDKLGVDALLGNDGKRGQLALELGGVDATEEDRSGGSFEVVQP